MTVAHTLSAALAVFALMLAAPAPAQVFPSRPVRMIVAQGAGGSSDIVARVVGQALGEALGQPVIVENRPGAGGIIGTELAAKAPPDGYTIIFGSSTTMAANVYLYKKLPFDPVKDFSPLAMTAVADFALIVPASSPASNLREFISLAKSRPGQLNYGYGTSSGLLCGEMFKAAAGVDITKVAYKSSPQALNDLMSNQLQFLCEPLTTSLPAAKSGKVRILAVTGAKRTPFAPELPTAQEAGAPGVEYQAWVAFFAPAGVPREAAARLSAELVRVTNLPAVAERIRAVGFEPTPGGAQQLAAAQRDEMARLAKVIKEAGIQAE